MPETELSECDGLLARIAALEQVVAAVVADIYRRLPGGANSALDLDTKVADMFPSRDQEDAVYRQSRSDAEDALGWIRSALSV